MKYIENKFILLLLLAVFLSVYGIRLVSSSKLYVSIDDIAEMNSEISEEEVYVADLRAKKNALLDKLEGQYSNKVKGIKNRYELGKEVEKYMMQAAFTEVAGEGITVIIDDGTREGLGLEQNASPLVVHDIDVRRLVLELRNAGAEAISVNGIRMVVGLSEVVCNGPTIRINGVQQSRPYVIKAIGDRYELANSLTRPNSYGQLLIKYGVHYELQTNYRLIIPEFNGLKRFDYAEQLED